MEADNNSHYLIYRVLGIATEEGKLIDEYQNMGRFLYKYAGSFLEEKLQSCALKKNFLRHKENSVYRINLVQDQSHLRLTASLAKTHTKLNGEMRQLTATISQKNIPE